MILGVLLIILGSPFTALLACAVITPRFQKVSKPARAYRLWCCRVLGWHASPAAQGFDGCSCTGVCPICRRAILQDGQGNWFASSRQDDQYQEPTP